MTGRPNTERFSQELLLAVLQVGREFWTSLANDDNDTLVRILTPDAFDELPTAERTRSYLGFSAEDCRHMRVYARATCLGPASLRILYIITEEPDPVPGSDPYRGRRLEFELDKGTWRVEPTRAHDRPATEIIDLRPLLDPATD